MKRFLILMLTGSMGFALAAQETIDILTLTGRYGLPQDYKDTYSEKATEYGSILSITAGAKLSAKSMIAINVNHFYFNVLGDPAIPDGIASPIILNGFILRTGLIQQLRNSRVLQLLIAPRLMSDFKNLDGNSFQLGAVATYGKKFHDDLTMSFGAMINQEFFGPYLVPLVNLYWKLSGQWSVEGMLPVTARVNYKVNDNLTAGFNHFGLITTYYLGDEAYSGDYMERQSIDLSLYARQRLFGPMFLEGMVGRSFGRNYKQFAGDQKVDFAIPLISFGDNRTVKNVTFKDGILLQLKLVINVRRPE
ncbi:MAG: DUF6268 family outer membrane beta-barrel protein [Bacteroidota bacterium]